MTVKVWNDAQLDAEIGEFIKRDGDNDEWVAAIKNLRDRAHARGDGIAVYVNNDLGHPEVGQWQVVTYGSREAQLETTAAIVGLEPLENRFIYGNLAAGDEVNQIPLTLPDIGGRINYRYLLEAIVPPIQQDTHDRLVTLTVKVRGGATEEEASAIVRAAIDNGLDLWSSSNGEVGFDDQNDTGIDTYDRGIRAEVIDAAVI